MRQLSITRFDSSKFNPRASEFQGQLTRASDLYYIKARAISVSMCIRYTSFSRAREDTSRDGSLEACNNRRVGFSIPFLRRDASFSRDFRETRGKWKIRVELFKFEAIEATTFSRQKVGHEWEREGGEPLESSCYYAQSSCIVYILIYRSERERESCLCAWQLRGVYNIYICIE